MDFKLNEHQSLIKESVRSFILKEFPEDRVKELCLKREYPIEFDKKIAELGLLGICFPEKYGGSNFGTTEVAITIEELSKFSIDLGISYGLNILGGLTILHFGTDIQKKNYLPEMINAKISFSLGYYEPFLFNFNDLSKRNLNVSTLFNEDLVINGSAIYSENKDPDKNFILLPLKIENGLILKLLPQRLLGRGEVVHTLGRDLLGLVKFNIKDLKFSKDQIIISDNERKILSFLENMMKFINLMSCIGNMHTVISETISHAKTRVQFGVPIGTFQSLQHLISDAKVKVDASQLFGYWISWLIENNREIHSIEKEINMANCYITQSFIDAVNVGIQVMGGYGYIKEHNMERYIRDARMTTYFIEDTFLQKLLIAKKLGVFQGG